MASSAVSGVGTEFQRGDGASPSEGFTTVAEIISIGGPDKTRGDIQVTSLDSTDGYREYVPGFRDGGSVTLSMNFTITGYNNMNDDFESDDSVNYQIVLPDPSNTTLGFTAFVTAIGLAVNYDDRITSDVSLKITGVTTITT